MIEKIAGMGIGIIGLSGIGIGVFLTKIGLDILKSANTNGHTTNNFVEFFITMIIGGPIAFGGITSIILGTGCCISTMLIMK